MNDRSRRVIEQLAGEFVSGLGPEGSHPLPGGGTLSREENPVTKHYLLASDFDQTLSFNDSGQVLSEIIGSRAFEEKVWGLSLTNLVQQGGELAYLLRHDPEFRAVRREHLVEVGRRIRLKPDIRRLVGVLEEGIPGHRFSFFVISAAPELVIQSALAGLVPKDRIFGTRFEWDEGTGEVRSILRVPAGYGKVAVLDELQARLEVASDRVVYVGDGSSDVHVMLHVNHREGFTIAVSEARLVTPIARRTILGDDALSVLVPVLEDVVGLDRTRVRAFFEAQGLSIREWDRVRTDRLSIGGPGEGTPAAASA
jgi:HAD superfamily phosphoserine phosphatase-like hydrolase